ncbi:MAG TPA: alpha/beta hydrolase [Verrucomicrobiae bacterium]|jgi:acetyl esterase/lipase|nr:alpha/beta hydrolase [Verrucomicrobiae bacterium]
MKKSIPLLMAWSVLSIAMAAAQQPNMRLPQQPVSPQQTAPQSGEVKVLENVVYGTVKGTDLHLDVYEPADLGTQNRPAVILIHGGGWTSFDKSTMRGIGQFLARSGFVAFSVDYRLFHPPDENRWPDQLDDVQRAVRWIRANAGKYGVNPEKMGAFGHSAGAQLAALLGMEDTRDNSDPALAKYSSRVQAVVAVSCPADLTKDHDRDGDAFFSSFLGADYKKNPEAWQDASPVFHAAKKDAPFLIFHGTKDQDVPMEQAQELYDKLRAAHVPATLIKVDDEHTFQTQEARRRLAIESREFYYQYLAGQ